MGNTSLVEQVVDLLNGKKKGLGQTFRDKLQSKATSSEGQIRELNNFLRIELGNVPMNTREERSVLLDNIKEATWLDYFVKYILPVLVRFNVPAE